MPQPSARRGIRAAEAFGLTVFLVTVVLLSGLFITLVVHGLQGVQAIAAAVSTAFAALAAAAMLVDATDLWVRGRKMTAHSVRRLRSLAFIAVLVALVASLIGGNSLVILFLGPAMIAYVFISRGRPGNASTAASGRPRRGSVGARPGASGSSSARSRQRRGGKKRR